jgi:NAD(P)-dependent dehydrogenase (short-subunit alcohol dehydrogenase family)
MTKWRRRLRDGEHDLPSQVGRTVLITGANAGLGLATAKALAAKGAHVLMACRNSTKANAAAATVRSVSTATVEVLPLDLSSLESVAECAKQVLGRESQLDLLINNAGLMGVDRTETADGFEMQIGVNHLGHFALAARLMPLVLATPASRVVSMSSTFYRPGRVVTDDLNFERRKYNRWAAYAQGKLANLLFSLELQRRLTEAGQQTIALSAHPGGARTDLGSEGSALANKFVAPAMVLLQPVEQGIRPMLRAATDPLARGGEFYGPRFIARGAPVLERPNRKARDVENARRLWAVSEQLTGLVFEIPPTKRTLEGARSSPSDQIHENPRGLTHGQ